MPKENFAVARLATGSFPTDGIDSAGKQAASWTDAVDAQVTEYYLNEVGVSQEKLDLEKEWELEAHLKARQAAYEELVRLGEKGALSSCRGLDRLMVMLTTQLIIDFAIKAKRNKQDTAEMTGMQVINMALLPAGDPFNPPEWFSGSDHGFLNDGGRSKSTTKVTGNEQPAWVNLLSVGFLATSVVVDYMSTMLTENRTHLAPMSELCKEVGRRINREIQAIGWYRLNVKGVEAAANKLPPGTDLDHAFMKLTRGMQHKTEALRRKRRLKPEDGAAGYPDLQVPTKEDYLEKWDERTCEKVGSMYVALLINGGFLEPGEAANGAGHSYESVSITDEGKATFAEMVERNLMAAYQSLPMLIPPVPHSCRPNGTIAGRDVGGYLLDSYAQTHRRTISGSYLGHHTPKKIREGEGEPGWIDQLNAAQNVEMALNMDVWNLIQEISDSKKGCPVGEDENGNIVYERLSVHSLQLFSKPRADDLQRISEGYNVAITQAKANGDLSLAVTLTEELRYRLKRLHEQALYDRGNAARIQTLIWTCKQLEKFGCTDSFYNVWFVCKRRRFYALGALNPIEREVSKALLLLGKDQRVDFAGDPQLEEQVKLDLLWTIATCWGAPAPDFTADGEDMVKSDKLAPAERSQWAGDPEQIETILKIGRNPLDPESFAIWAGTKGTDHLGRTVLKGGGSDPWMFVAACMEYVALFDEENPERRTWTQLPSGRDCTGSGLQMAAVSACDKYDGALTNVASPLGDSGRPADVYIEIFRAGLGLVKEDHFSHTLSANTSETILGDNRFAQRLKEYGLKRNAAKPVGMIATYGGCAKTNCDDVFDLLRENQRPFIPRFQGLDSRHEQKLLELSTDDYEKLAAKRGEVLPIGQRTPQQLLDRINEIRAEDKALVDNAKRQGLVVKPSAMQLFKLRSDKPPAEPNPKSKRYTSCLDPEEREALFQADYELYEMKLQVFKADLVTLDEFNARVHERIETVFRYLNVVRRIYGLKRIVRKQGEIRVHDVDPLIHNFVRAMRTGLESVVPSVVRLRNVIKEWLGHTDFPWERVAQQNGGIQWEMPHGWRTRQRHLIDKGIDDVSKNRVFTVPKSSQWDRLSHMSQWLEEFVRSDNVDDIEEMIKSVAEGQGAYQEVTTKRVKWSRSDDTVGALTSLAVSKIDKRKHTDAIVANFCHSMDAALACEMRRQLALKGLDCLQVHDCFFTTIGRSQELLQAARDAIKVLFGEAVGKNRPLDMFCRGIGHPGLAQEIRLPVDHERYYDPAKHADDLNNFIC